MVAEKAAMTEPSLLMDSLSAIAALMFVLAILGVLAWAVKRYGLVPGQPRIKTGEKKINIVESRVLDNRNRLVAVEWNGKEYLLATNPAGVRPVGEHQVDSQKSKSDDLRT